MQKTTFALLLLPLISVSCKQKQHTIKSLYVEATPCAAACPVYKMGFHQDRTVTYKAEQVTKDTGLFTATLLPQQYDSLLNLLNKTDFPELKENYTTDFTDAATINLTIMYDNRIKRIRDQGEKGTSQLVNLYRYLDQLRERQQWKKMP